MSFPGRVVIVSTYYDVAGSIPGIVTIFKSELGL
jgi:hypothetical protein